MGSSLLLNEIGQVLTVRAAQSIRTRSTETEHTEHSALSAPGRRSRAAAARSGRSGAATSARRTTGTGRRSPAPRGAGWCSGFEPGLATLAINRSNTGTGQITSDHVRADLGTPISAGKCDMACAEQSWQALHGPRHEEPCLPSMHRQANCIKSLAHQEEQTAHPRALSVVSGAFCLGDRAGRTVTNTIFCCQPP